MSTCTPYITVTVVDDGSKAVDMLATKKFDLCFFDLHMPIMVGRCKLDPSLILARP